GCADEKRGGVAVKLDDLGNEQKLARDPAVGQAALQPLIDEAFMRRVLIDNDERIFGLGYDKGILELGPRCAERIVRAYRFVGCGIAARVAARLGERRERRLRSFGKAEAPSADRGMVVADALRRAGSAGVGYSVECAL